MFHGGRLVLRIYGIGLAQIAALAATLAIAFDEMAERIEHLVRGQRELLANVSHELRTPLARIRVALDLAAEGSAQDAAAQLSGIAGDLAELERLTDDILTSARLELSSAQPPLRLQRTPAAEMVEEAALRFRSSHPGAAVFFGLKIRALSAGLSESALNADIRTDAAIVNANCR